MRSPRRWHVYWLATRPAFLTASAAPVLVGSCAGLAGGATFHWPLFLLALVGIMALHAGANAVNDYCDHLSGNDWVNTNPTPFSGGRRFIQQGLLTPRATLLIGLACLGIGGALGLIILAMTRSLFVLGIGLAGILGALFYTARPVQLAYRGIGEVVIGLLFGLLPVYGSYVLQTQRIDGVPLVPALIVSDLIFLVIFINEFPDRRADAQVGRRTLVVRLGVARCARLYRLALMCTYALAVGMLFQEVTLWAGVLYLLTLPLAVLAWRAASPQALEATGQWRANQLTILVHGLGSLALALGLALYRAW